jgi:heme-degrading monooxygenase HmoA
VARGFKVTQGREVEFEKVYGQDGSWQQVLGNAEGFLLTELRYESVVERRYTSFDHWRSHKEFEAFREEQQSRLEEFQQQVAEQGLIESETLLGSFYLEQDGPDFDEGSGLVPA